jgi:hypothetical protein
MNGLAFSGLLKYLWLGYLKTCCWHPQLEQNPENPESIMGHGGGGGIGGYYQREVNTDRLVSQQDYNNYGGF